MYENNDGQVKNGVKRTNYTHDAMIDLIISNPAIEQREIARHFGYSEGWVSTLMASDSFQAAFERRKEEMVDPIVRHSCEEQFKGLVFQSMQVLKRKLEANPSDQLALEVFKNSTRAMGYGAKLKVEGEVKHSHSLISVLSSIPPTPAPAALPSPTEKVVNG